MKKILAFILSVFTISNIQAEDNLKYYVGKAIQNNLKLIRHWWQRINFILYPGDEATCEERIISHSGDIKITIFFHCGDYKITIFSVEITKITIFSQW